MSKFRGLPQNRKMRHDSHFVEEITSQATESVGRMIEIDRVRPNPHQPRKSFGDLSEMVASIKEKGVLEPILVRHHEDEDFYEIIAGERRYQSAKMAGLTKVPCIEVDVDARGMLEISLVENLQRKDLTPFEEAAALKRLTEQFRYTHEEIARKLGKSRTVVTEVLSLAKMPDEIMDRCRHADIDSKSMLLQIVRQGSVEAMHSLVDKISGEGITREEARQFNKDERARRPKRYVFRFRPDDRDFQVRLTFDRPEVERNELIQALRELIEQIESGEAEAGSPEGETSSSRVAPPANGNGSTRSDHDWAR